MKKIYIDSIAKRLQVKDWQVICKASSDNHYAFFAFLFLFFFILFLNFTKLY